MTWTKRKDLNNLLWSQKCSFTPNGTTTVCLVGRLPSLLNITPGLCCIIQKHSNYAIKNSHYIPRENSNWLNRECVSVNKYIFCFHYIAMTLPCSSWRKVLLSVTKSSWLACQSTVRRSPTTSRATSQAGVVSTVRPAAKSTNKIHVFFLFPTLINTFFFST